MVGKQNGAELNTIEIEINSKLGMECISTLYNRVLVLRNPPVYIPGKEVHQVLRSGGIWSERGSHHMRSSMVPALVPVVSTISAQTGSNRFTIHNPTYTQIGADYTQVPIS